MRGDEKRQDRMRSLGIWTWLAIVEKDAEKLSRGGRVALESLREDLERLSASETTRSR